MVDATMLYAIKLGPMETEDGPITAYVGFTETGALRPVLALKDSDGLAQLAAQAQGHELRCERALLRAGKLLGFAAAPVPDWARTGRATLAFGLSGPGPGRVRNLDVVEHFLASVVAFCHAAPWRFWCDNDPLAVTISSTAAKEYEACIMGAGGQEYGVALYEEKGAVKKLVRLVDAGRMRDAANLGRLALTLDDEPRWAAKAIGDAFGAECVPVPLRVSGGGPRPVDEEELVTLAAALRAIAGLDSDKLESACDLLIAGARVSARVTAPEPELMFSELSEDDVLQVALEAQRAARMGRRKSR
jgi:hypothetical protein